MLSGIIPALLLAAQPVPPPPPPLPPLRLDAAAPIVTVSVNGAELRLRVDPGATGNVAINASAAARAGLADPQRLVAGKRVDLGRSLTQVGKVTVTETTSAEVLGYADRVLPLTLAWPGHDFVTGADGLINPRQLPHDEIRLVRRAVGVSDVVTRLAMRWDEGRGLCGEVGQGRGRIDVVIAPMTPETLATAAAASLLAAANAGRLSGPARDGLVSHGVKRPVRDVVFPGSVDIAGIRMTRVAARVFDWSGSSDIPDADLAAGEAVVGGRAGAQRQWAKLAIGADHLDSCAEIIWRRLPETIDLVCPAVR